MDSRDKSAGAPESTGKHKIPVGYDFAKAAVLAFVGRRRQIRSQINAELDAIRKAGFPVTLRELSDYYPAPSGDNAAGVYGQAFEKFSATTPPDDKLPVAGSAKLPPRGEPLPDEMKAGVSAYLAANAQALELLHKAAAIEGCRFDLDFSLGVGIPLHHLMALRHAARLLQLQALMKVEGGKPDEAAAAIADSFSAARAVRNEPLLISQLVRIAVTNSSVNTLERVLSRTALGDRQLADLSKAIASQENPEPLMRGLAGERCRGEDIFNNFSRYSGELNYEPGTTALFLWKWSGLKTEDHLMYLRLMAELVRAAGGSAKDMRDLTMREEEFRRMPDYYLLTRLLVPALSRAHEEQLKMLARLRAACAAIAVERFRMANGRLPDSLDELTPKWLDAVPADPFDDKPIRYRKLAKGYVTYSVGPDLKDDCGRERDSKEYNAPYDIPFIVAR